MIHLQDQKEETYSGFVAILFMRQPKILLLSNIDFFFPPPPSQDIPDRMKLDLSIEMAIAILISPKIYNFSELVSSICRFWSCSCICFRNVHGAMHPFCMGGHDFGITQFSAQLFKDFDITFLNQN